MEKQAKPASRSVSPASYFDAERKIPKMVKSRYEIIEEIGKGAHGRIYLGKDKLNKTPVAIKLVNLHFTKHRVDGSHHQKQF